LHLRIVLRVVANDFTGIDNAPELARIVGDAVKNLERDAVLVVNVLRLNRLGKELLQVALANISTEVALVASAVSGQKVAVVDLAGRTNGNLHVLELAAEAPGGEDETNMLVRRLGPAVKIVREGERVGIDHVHFPLVDQGLVPVSGVIRTRHDDT